MKTRPNWTALKRSDDPVITVIEDVQVVAMPRVLGEGDLRPLGRALDIAFAARGPIILDVDVHPDLCREAAAVIRHFAHRVARRWRPIALSTATPGLAQHLADSDSPLPIQVHPDLTTALQSFRPLTTKPLGQILVERFGLGRAKLIEALRRQRIEGLLLGEILVDGDFLAAKTLLQALALQAGAY